MRGALPAIIATALSAGLCACAADHTSLPTTPTAPTTVAPAAAGTIYVKGSVYDTVFRPLAGASVAVLDGPQSGLVTASDFRGEFAFAGIFDESTRFQASKSGYTLQVSKLSPLCERCNPPRWVNFALDVPAEPAVVSGTYDVTFAVDPTCGSFPTESRERTHTATIPANARGYFSVPVSGAFGAYPYIGGGISGNNVAFYMEGFAEQLSPNSFLIYNLIASATIESSPQVIDAVATGSVGYCELPAPSGTGIECYSQAAMYNVCQRDNHRLTFTKR